MLQVIFTIIWFNFYTDAKSTTLTTSTAKTEPAWSYDDESKWPGFQCRAGSRRQSPIDIKTSDVIRDYTQQFIKYGPLQFSGYNKVLVSGINNGHTIQFSSEGNEEMHPKLQGGPLKHSYRLEQLHFHWLSEHSIDGNKYPMEIHFVHVRTDLTMAQALRERDGFAIVAIFGTVQAEVEEDNQVMEEVIQHVPKLMESGDRISGVLLDMAKLLSSNTESYYTYEGSLTTPECNEAVVWIIFQTPIYLSDAQYKMFGKIGVGRHNFRSLQKLNRHMVFTPARAESKLRAPQIVTFLVDMYNKLTGFFTNISSNVTICGARSLLSARAGVNTMCRFNFCKLLKLCRPTPILPNILY